MTAHKGQSHRQTKAEMQGAVHAVIEHGNISAAAKATGIPRRTLQYRLDNAAKAGLTKPRAQSNPSRWRPGAEIVAARKAEFERYKASKRSDGNIVFLPDDGPFMVVCYGDPHLDSAGTDLALWERWIGVLDRGKHITGILLGDLLDQWPRVLGHLYGASETPAPEGYILLEHYLEEIGEHLDASVGGNHDGFSGYADLLGMMLKQHGILHKSDELRFIYRAPGGREVTVTARHSWPGRSMYSPVHGIKRAAKFGIRDNILLGGHTHISGEALEIDPMTKRISHCFQVGAFKTLDEYAERLGFMDGHISPAIALVIDPSLPDTDPEMIKHFHDPNRAVDFLAFLRRKAR